MVQKNVIFHLSSVNRLLCRDMFLYCVDQKGERLQFHHIINTDGIKDGCSDVTHWFVVSHFKALILCECLQTYFVSQPHHLIHENTLFTLDELAPTCPCKQPHL